MSHACTPILVGVSSPVSEISLLSKTAKFPFLTMDYSPWSSKNLINRNRLKTFMQVGHDVTCMHTDFGGHGLSSFRDFIILSSKACFVLLLCNALCDLVHFHFQFFLRGTIEKTENISPTSVSLCIGPDSKSLVWNIGQKFPSKSLEVSLSVTVLFTEFSTDEEESSDKSVDERFCVEQNSYCEVGKNKQSLYHHYINLIVEFQDI